MTTRRKHGLRPARWFVAGAAVLGFFIARAEEPKKAPPVPAPASAVAYHPARPYWVELTLAQRDALAPLAEDWERLDIQTKRKWVEIANRYPRMKPEEQAHTRERMREWAQLTPEQRRVARDSYARIRAMPPEERAEMLRKYQELTPEAREKLAHQGLAAKPLVVPRPQTTASPSPQRNQLREGTKDRNPAIAAQKRQNPPTPKAMGEAAPAAAVPAPGAPAGLAPAAPVAPSTPANAPAPAATTPAS
jgi:Protein of unknown function (DUF3106)